MTMNMLIAAFLLGLAYAAVELCEAVFDHYKKYIIIDDGFSVRRFLRDHKYLVVFIVTYSILGTIGTYVA